MTDRFYKELTAFILAAILWFCILWSFQAKQARAEQVELESVIKSHPHYKDLMTFSQIEELLTKSNKHKNAKH